MSEASISLLFVDDEPGILSALRRLFRPHGYRILTAESAAEGLEILAAEEINLVISDMRMPEMDGAHFLQEVKLRWPNTMRMLLTGYADIHSTVAAINQGAVYRYISKPWDDLEIVTIVQEATKRQQLEAENQRLSQLVQVQNNELKELNSSLEQKVLERVAELNQALCFVEQAHSELKKSFMASVQVFAGMIELRSGPAGGAIAGHGRRVAEHAQKVARGMQLPDAEVQTIMLAGLLHDIGKLGLPDELLSKAFNGLSTEQRSQVMKVPVIGQNILMGIDKFKDAALLVRHIHEHFDGSGYPDRLAGLAIPMGSRILAVANEYDALQIGTLFQRPLKAKEAQDYLIENRGKRYDPNVVDAFCLVIASTLQTIVSEVQLRTMHLKKGMQLAHDLIHRDGYMLLTAGCILTAEIIEQLARMERSDKLTLTLTIRQN